MKDIDTRALMAEAKFYESYSRWDDNLDRYETWDESVSRVMNMHRTYYTDLMSDELSLLINEAEASYKLKYVLGAQRALQFGGEQILKHQMRMYNCFSTETRFLTRDGMKSFTEYEDGDKVIVKTHTGDWKPAVVKSYGKQTLSKITFNRKGAKKEVFATPNHRWLLNDGSETTMLKVGDKLQTIKDTSFEDFDWDTADPNQRLMWCYGYVYGDGTRTRVDGEYKYSSARLCGNDVRFVDRFTSLGFKSSLALSVDGDIIVYTGSYLKSLPSVNDTENNLRAFVRGFLDADGEKSSSYWENTGKSFSSIYQVSPDAQDFIRNVFPLVGVWITSESDHSKKERFVELSGKLYQRMGTSFSTMSTYGTKYSAYWAVESIEQTDRNETVWCLEVEDDRSFILDGGIITGNCTSSYADRPEFFGELFYVLLCGAGAGFSVQKHHVAKLPKIAQRKGQVKMHEVDDSIEGWAMALDVLLSSYFQGGKHTEFQGRRIYFDLSKIRPKGSIISGGFKAPGPEPLRRALDKIEHLIQGIILRGEDSLQPIHVYDICMHTADAVLAGGVRRSATICLFSPDDTDMIEAKTGNWFTDNPQRGRSNNSAVIVRGEASREQFADIMKSIKEYGEPGFVFVESTEHTTNPCVEIGMLPQIDGKSGFQGCNLSEINGSKCTTKEEFFQACRVGAILGTLQAGYTDFKFLSDTTKQIFDREALIGVSITGWMNSPDILFNEDTLREGAEIVKTINKQVAKLIKINAAARCTCTKPSGNASVLLGTSSGIHGDHSPMYIRNVQMNHEQEVAQLIKKTNPYMVEESVWSDAKSDYVISFPVIAPKTSLFKKDLFGIKLLEKVKLVQQSWVEAGTDEELCVDPTVRHNVSNTVQVHPDQWDEVEDFVFNNRYSFAGISFLAATGDKDFNQAPMTEVLSEEQLVEKYGRAAFFASGLIVESAKGFSDLWAATFAAQADDDQYCGEQKDQGAEWLRRFTNFADNYFAGDMKNAEYCLKDVYLLHKWTKIQQNMQPIDFKSSLSERNYIDIDTMGSQACAGGACEI